MSKTIIARIVPATKGTYQGVLRTPEGKELRTNQGTKGQVLQEFAMMPEYRKNPARITLQ